MSTNKVVGVICASLGVVSFVDHAVKSHQLVASAFTGAMNAVLWWVFAFAVLCAYRWLKRRLAR